ncbi:MAG: hypothetical protein ACRDSH_06405, partial [Pseudonocardiaceae bacterium]
PEVTLQGGSRGSPVSPAQLRAHVDVQGRSATIFFSRAFSRSICLSRLASSAFIPPNSLRYRYPGRLR